MWVIIPVKAFKNAKLRLTTVLSPQQRAHFSYLMLEDILQTLNSSDDVEGITLVSSDDSVRILATRYNAGLLLTDKDSGYSEDATQAIKKLSQACKTTIAIIPADVPQLAHDDLSRLNKTHEKGLTLCPAVVDGGTNGLLFTPPLIIPLMFGLDSLDKYRTAAEQREIPVTLSKMTSLERDVDRPADLRWFKNLPAGGKAWSYVQDIDIN